MIRRNSWEDLPSMFSASASSEPDWEALPPMFAPQQARRPGLVVRIRPSLPWLRADLSDALAALGATDSSVSALVAGRVDDAEGSELRLADLAEACAVRHAAWKLAADTSAERRLRVQAIEIERALDQATDGAAAGCLVRAVGALQRAAGFAPVSVRVMSRGPRRPVRLLGSSPDLAGLRVALVSVPAVFEAERQRVWDSLTPLPEGFDEERCTEACESMLDQACPHEVRHTRSFCEGMHAVQELLERAGAEAWVLEDYSNYPDTPCVVWFRHPGEHHLFWEVTKLRGDVDVTAWPMEMIDEKEFYEVVEYGYVGNPPRGGRREGR